jgi:hypothetical protein
MVFDVLLRPEYVIFSKVRRCPWRKCCGTFDIISIVRPSGRGVLLAALFPLLDDDSKSKLGAHVA